MKTPPKSGVKPKSKTGRRAEDKWSPEVLVFGYTALPNLLLRAQARLKITPSQFNVLAQLTEHWWKAKEYPFPAKDRIAARMKKSPRQIQRYIAQLEKAGYIKRIERFTGRKAPDRDRLYPKIKSLYEARGSFTHAAREIPPDKFKETVQLGRDVFAKIIDEEALPVPRLEEADAPTQH